MTNSIGTIEGKFLSNKTDGENPEPLHGTIRFTPTEAATADGKTYPGAPATGTVENGNLIPTRLFAPATYEVRFALYDSALRRVKAECRQITINPGETINLSGTATPPPTPQPNTNRTWLELETWMKQRGSTWKSLEDALAAKP